MASIATQVLGTLAAASFLILQVNADAPVASVAPAAGGDAAPSAPDYRVTQTVSLGAPDRWDYLTFDSSASRVYVAHGDRVTVFDTVSGHLFVLNGDTATITVIDPKLNQAVATILGGGKLEFGVSGNNGKLYVNGAGNNELIRVDTHSNKVDAHWPMSGCKSPHGLAIDLLTHRLFSSCVNNVLKVVNADSGEVVASVPIGAGTDFAGFDPKRRLVFSSNGKDGTLSIIQEKDAQTFVPLGDIKTAPMARTMTINPDTGRLFLVAADADPNPKVTGLDQHHMAIAAGSVKLIILDPVP